MGWASRTPSSVLAATLVQETLAAATAKRKEKAAVTSWVRIVLQTRVVIQALQCQHILIHFENQAERLNKDALLRATNSTSEAQKHHAKVQSKLALDCGKATQTVDDDGCNGQPCNMSTSTTWDEAGTKPTCDVVYVPKMRESMVDRAVCARTQRWKHDANHARNRDVSPKKQEIAHLVV